MSVQALAADPNVVVLHPQAAPLYDAQSRQRARTEAFFDDQPSISEQVVNALCAYSATKMTHKEGRMAMEIGVELLSRIGPITTPDEIVAATLKAINNPESKDCLPELLLASFGLSAMTQDIPEHARATLIGLVESCFVALDKQAFA